MTMLYKYHSIVWSVGTSITNQMNEKQNKTTFVQLIYQTGAGYTMQAF